MTAGAPRTWMPRQTFYRPQKTVAGFAGHLGRRSAPAGIGAYYQSLPYKQIGIGYYDAVGDTANKFDVTSPSDQELLNLLQSSQPAGPYIPWAEREGDLDWVEVDPATNRLLFVVTQRQLNEAQQITGEPVTTIAILSPTPLSIADVERAFDSSRYEWLKTEAVYSQSDPNPTPRMIFLHWGRLRSVEDMQGRTSDEFFLSRTLAGSLTFPVEAPLVNAREAPNETFEDALKQQFPPKQVQEALEPSDAPPSEVKAMLTVGVVTTLLFVGIAGGTAWAVSKWLR